MKTVKVMMTLIEAVLAVPLLTFIIGWSIIVAAPVVVMAGGLFILAYSAISKIVKEMGELLSVRDTKIFGLSGLPDDTYLKEIFSFELENILRYSPDKLGNRTCFCIKKGGKDFFGILRLGNRKGNFFQKIHGKTREEVMDKYMIKFHEYQENFPIRKGKRLIETKDCNSQLCPFEALDKFFMRTPAFSTNKYRAA
ncbi:MAG: hypothetical protein OEZ13_03180 [Spirochaetia bacterium]|nr:hypothetical protein [Spirochaetia bacterium]